MKQLSMSIQAFDTTMQLLGGTGQWLLPAFVRKNGQGSEAYLSGRDELCRSGWAELDFDGKLHPTREFSRMIFSLTHLRGLLRLELEEETCWYLRSTVEMMVLSCREDRITLDRCRAGTGVAALQDALLHTAAGHVTTQNRGEIHETQLEETPCDSDARRAYTETQLQIFFGEGEPHA